MNAASIQSQISPPVAPAAKDFSDAEIKTRNVVKDSTPEAPRTDFRDLITNSVAEIKAEREAKKNGDLSGAKSEEDFLKRLADQTQQKRVPKNTLDKDDFLKLFVTQLQAQNPLNPQDSAEMATQLAQFNGLEQMLNMNKGLDKLAKAQAQSQSAGMIEFIGKELTLKGGKLTLDGGKVSDTSFALSQPMSEVTLEVRDSAGVVVAERNLGAMQPGNHKLAWDGKKADGSSAPNGTYTAKVSARDNQGAIIPIDLTSKVRVTGVDLQAEGGGLFTEIGKVGISDIISVGVPGFTKAAQVAPTPPKATATTPTGGSPNAASDPAAPVSQATEQQPPPNFREAAVSGNSPAEIVPPNGTMSAPAKTPEAQAAESQKLHPLSPAEAIARS